MNCQVCKGEGAQQHVLSGCVYADLCADCRNQYHEWIAQFPETAEYLVSSMVVKFAMMNGLPNASDAAPVVNEFLAIESKMHQKTLDWLAGRFG